MGTNSLYLSANTPSIFSLLFVPYLWEVCLLLLFQEEAAIAYSLHVLARWEVARWGVSNSSIMP